MRQCEVSISSLLPIQDYVDREKVERLRLSTHPLPPIVTLAYGYGAIILDGHHRVAAQYRRGVIIVPSIVIETDEDVPRLSDLDLFWLNSPTIEQIVNRYVEDWLPECRDAGIESFYDLLIHNNLNDIPKCVTLNAHAEL